MGPMAALPPVPHSPSTPAAESPPEAVPEAPVPTVAKGRPVRARQPTRSLIGEASKALASEWNLTAADKRASTWAHDGGEGNKRAKTPEKGQNSGQIAEIEVKLRFLSTSTNKGL